MRELSGVVCAICLALGSACTKTGATSSDGAAERAGGETADAASRSETNTPGTGGRGGTGDGTGGGAGEIPTPDANCGLRTIGLANVPPDVLIVLDRSASMSWEAEGMCATPECSRWSETTAAIKQVVTATDAKIRWGLKFFPDGADDSDACQVVGGVAVPIGDRTAARIVAAIDGRYPGGLTPTRVAVTTAAAHLTQLQDSNPKYILLATDGEPNCSGTLNPNPPPGPPGTISIPIDTDAVGTVLAVKDVAATGIPTFVVGIATSSNDPQSDATLSQLARVGGRPRAATPPYYPVNNAPDLVAALTAIEGQVASCGFGLGGRPPVPDNIAVNAAGVRIPRDPSHGNGWDYGTGETSIVLYGSYCDKAKAGQLGNVQAIFGCPGVVIHSDGDHGERLHAGGWFTLIVNYESAIDGLVNLGWPDLR